jgi:hypothetical protein
MYKIIAVDFDGCLVEHDYPSIGATISQTLDSLKMEQAAGAKVILWTCRCDRYLEDADRWCNSRGLRLDAVNENLPEMVKLYGGDPRKILADEYWDDRAVRLP